MHHYSHTIITETHTNYATLCLLATKLIQACLKIQHFPFKTKKSSLPDLSRNSHVLCSCRKQSLPHCWLQMIYNCACCKNSPVQSEWQRFIYGNGLSAYRPTAALIGYGTPYGPDLCLSIESDSEAFCLQQNLLHS